jgi:type II secretory pathway pseudopilin PulG
LTLVEVLVATSLMAMVGGAVVSALAGGVNVWERAQAVGTTTASAAIAGEWVQRELRNARRSTLVLFDGEPGACRFAAVGLRVREPDPSRRRASLEPEEPPRMEQPELGRVAYAFKAQTSQLCRSFVPYPLLGRGVAAQRCQVILEGVKRVRFQYYGKDATGEGRWTPRWKAPGPPEAVRVEMEMAESLPGQAAYSFVVYLGSGGDDDTNQ